MSPDAGIPSLSINYVEISGHTIAYRRRGEGPPVLLVHGVASYSFLWNEVIETLSPHYDVIATDLLGCGDSDKPEGVDYSIDAQADILIEFISQLGLEQVHLVGHDIGGGVVMLMSVKRPRLILDLTLINPVGYDYWPVQPITTMRLPLIRALTNAIMHQGMMNIVLRRGVFNKERLTRERLDEFWKPLKDKRGKDGFIQLIRCINNQLLTAITDQLRQLPMPTLIIRGDADAYLDQAITQKLADDIPNAQLVRFAHGGHFIQIDCPDEIASTMSRFFARSP